jgi:hypothetical protein
MTPVSVARSTCAHDGDAVLSRHTIARSDFLILMVLSPFAWHSTVSGSDDASVTAS